MENEPSPEQAPGYCAVRSKFTHKSDCKGLKTLFWNQGDIVGVDKKAAPANYFLAYFLLLLMILMASVGLGSIIVIVGGIAFRGATFDFVLAIFLLVIAICTMAPLYGVFSLARLLLPYKLFVDIKNSKVTYRFIGVRLTRKWQGEALIMVLPIHSRGDWGFRLKIGSLSKNFFIFDSGLIGSVENARANSLALVSKIFSIPVRFEKW